MSTGAKVPSGNIGTSYPEVISPKQLAEIIGVSVKTVYSWIAAGRLKGACRKRGKHVLINRSIAIERIFSGPEWR